MINPGISSFISKPLPKAPSNNVQALSKGKDQDWIKRIIRLILAIGKRCGVVHLKILLQNSSSIRNSTNRNTTKTNP